MYTQKRSGCLCICFYYSTYTREGNVDKSCHVSSMVNTFIQIDRHLCTQIIITGLKHEIEMQMKNVNDI